MEGIYTRSNEITNAPKNYSDRHSMFINISSIGTPFQLYFPDNDYHFYKRWKTSGEWGEWYQYTGIPVSKANLPQFVRQRYSKTGVSVGGSPVNFSMGGTKSGYTPISTSSLIRNNTTTVICGLQSINYSNGSFGCSGYAKSINSNTYTMNFYIDVLWMRN